MARDAVFRSWQNDRAKHYRRINNIDDMLGTAVNVQAMVFGNLGDTSGTGVGFTRNPATGVKEFYGEFLMNAQGEDVVAGIRTPVHILELRRSCRRCTTSCATSPRGWKNTIATCRISSSPFRTASSTCCKPAMASVPGGGGARCHSDGRRRPDHARKKRSSASSRTSCMTSWFRGLMRKSQKLKCLRRDFRLRRVRPSDRSYLPLMKRSRKPERRQESCHSGSRRNHAGRYSRHGSRRRHSDLTRWNDQPCCRRHPRHGQVLRRRRWRY